MLKKTLPFSRTMMGATAGLLLVLSVSTPAFADANATITKSGVDVTNGSSSVASVGDTIKWTVTYENTTGKVVSADIQDGIVAPNSYVHGTLQAPAGWIPEWSTDNGSTWLTTEPSDASSVTNVRAYNAFLSTTATGNGAVFPAPNVPLAASLAESGGDGFQAYFTPDSVCTTFHVDGVFNVECFNKTTGAVESTKVLSTAISTLDRSQPVQDVATGRAYFLGSISGSDAVVCVDLSNASDPTLCNPTGYVTIGTTWSSPDLVKVGSSIFAWDGSKFYCVTTAMAPCAGQPFATSVSSARHASAIVAGGLIYATSASTSSSGVNQQQYVTCFNPVSHAICSGWTGGSPSGFKDASTSFPSSGSLQYAGADFVVPQTNASGVTTGVCTHSAFGQSSPYTGSHWACFNTDGSTNASNASELDAFHATHLGVYSGGLKAEMGQVSGSKIFLVYAADTSNVSGNEFDCFDWATGTGCTGGTGSDGWSGWSNSANPSEGQIMMPALSPSNDRYSNTAGQEGLYAVAVDPYDPVCLWTDADSGLMRSIDIATGVAGTCKTTATTQVAAAPTAAAGSAYCDGSPSHVSSWNEVRVTGISNADYSHALITIYDANGQPVSGFENLESSTGVVDISSIPFSDATTSLTASVTLEDVPTSLTWPTQSPGAEITWTGDPVQICFDTNVLNVTQTTTFANTVHETTTPQGDPGTTDTTTSNSFTVTTTSIDAPLAGSVGAMIVAVLAAGAFLVMRGLQNRRRSVKA